MKAEYRSNWRQASVERSGTVGITKYAEGPVGRFAFKIH